jgi:hypothetical protein
MREDNPILRRYFENNGLGDSCRVVLDEVIELSSGVEREGEHPYIFLGRLFKIARKNVELSDLNIYCKAYHGMELTHYLGRELPSLFPGGSSGDKRSSSVRDDQGLKFRAVGFSRNDF